MTRYCIAYVANKEIQEYFRSTAKDLEDKFQVNNLADRVSAHITLKYPFEIESAGDVGEMELRIEKVSHLLTQTPFSISGFGRFSDNKRTIFLEVEENAEFRSAMDQCMDKLGEFEEDRKFSASDRTFHVSVVRNLEEDMSDRVFDYLKSMQRPNFKAVFDNIALMRFKNEAWEVKKMFKLSQ
jgi:2'-5' RNA ligase